MDTGSLQPYKDAASSASSAVASQTEAAPGLLNQLKQNLTSIFAKDNPVINDRNSALETFLNAPSQARVSTLQPNMPMVEGSNLTLSPTQQDAITTSRRNAALVPLLGLNQTVSGMYGNIPGMVQGAGDIYNAQINGAKIRADQANGSLAQAFQELQLQEEAKRQAQAFAEQQRQFNETMAFNKSKVKASGAGTSPDLFSSIMALQAARGGGGAGTQSTTPGLAFQTAATRAQNLPPLSSFETGGGTTGGDGRSTFSDILSGLGQAGWSGLQSLGNLWTGGLH